MICTTCGMDNAATAKFCAECGTRMIAACPTCGTATTPGAKFCAECGTNLVARSDRPAGTVPNETPRARSDGLAERRLVSVLFADLVGFTTLAQDRDPEAVRELLTRYFDAARSAVERYGGTIEKFIGDAVMAVWGTPVAFEDDAERAVRAGLELVDAVRALGADGSGTPLAVRVGVTSGETAVTIGATGQGMVAGDVVNTASRLQSIAPPNQVLVDEGSERAARGAITFEAVGEQVLRGKSAGVAAWRALRVVAGRGGAGRAGSLEAPFVGRDDEFRLLKDLLDATSREGRPRLVSVMGQAGIGKSRLAWEFEKYIDGVVEPVYWHRGRSLSYGQSISFWALGEMVRTRAGIAEMDDADASRAKLRGAVAEYVPDESDRRWIEPHLASLLGLDEAPAGQRDEAFAAWRTFFERISDVGTTVLVFEDLQWADEGLLDFIDHLLEWSKAHPILVVTLARHELLDRRPEWGAVRRNFASIILEPLTAGAMRSLLDGLVPGLPEPAIAAILGRAEGIPLYAVETVRMLLDEGRLTEADGAYRPTGAMTDLAVPATLHALIASRLDSLSPEDRATVHAAAVLGQTFSLPALTAVVEVTRPDLEARLRALVRREILTLDADPRSPERGQYGFMQALIREVAYGTLSKRERRSRHLAAARYFEAVGDDELAAVLASHYVAAYRAAPDGEEGEATAVQARIALRAAADRAAAVHDYAGARTLLEEAREVTTDPDDAAAIDERICEMALLIVDLPAAEAAIRRAIERYQASGNTAAGARASAALGLVLIDAWRPAEAIPILEHAFSATDMDVPQDYRAAIAASLARAAVSGGDSEKGLIWADRAITLAEKADARRPLVDAIITRAWGVANAGRSREAFAILTGAIELARRYGLPQEELRALYNISAGIEEESPRIAENVRLGRAVAEKFGLTSWVLSFRLMEMDLGFFLGDWDRAMEIEASFNDSSNLMVETARNRVAASISGARGEFDEAERRLALVAAAFEGVTKANDIAALDTHMAHVRLSSGRYEEAFEAGMSATAHPEADSLGLTFAAEAAFWLDDADRLDAAAAAIERTSAPPRWAEAVRSEILGYVAWARGDTAEAATKLRRAAEIVTEMRETPWLASIGIARVRILGTRDAEGRAVAEETRHILEGLRARPYLELLERAIAEAATRQRPRSNAQPRAGAVRVER